MHVDRQYRIRNSQCPRVFARPRGSARRTSPTSSLRPIRRFAAIRNGWNPEELFVAALASCHQLWYLGLCAAEGICVESYSDAALGTMNEGVAGGAGEFTAVVLSPIVRITDATQIDRAIELHTTAHAMCFIARSVNFAVTVQPAVDAI